MSHFHEREHFFVYLPADADSTNENTSTDFTVTLGSPLVLPQGVWEVGLAEIRVPTYVHNIVRMNRPFKLYCNFQTRASYFIEWFVPPGNYSAPEFVKAFNEAMKKATFKNANGDPPSDAQITLEDTQRGYYGWSRGGTDLTSAHSESWLSYNHATKRMNFFCSPGEELDLEHELIKTVMGFTDHSWTVVSTPVGEFAQGGGLQTLMLEYRLFKATHPTLMNYHCHTLFVYTDIVHETVVGHVTSQILRAIGMSDIKDAASQGENMTKTFERIDYYPVKGEMIKDVKIWLRNTYGEAYPFDGGIPVLKYHFRRIKKRNPFQSLENPQKRKLIE